MKPSSSYVIHVNAWLLFPFSTSALWTVNAILQREAQFLYKERKCEQRTCDGRLQVKIGFCRCSQNHWWGLFNRNKRGLLWFH